MAVAQHPPDAALDPQQFRAGLNQEAGAETLRPFHLLKHRCGRLIGPWDILGQQSFNKTLQFCRPLCASKPKFSQGYQQLGVVLLVLTHISFQISD